MNFGVFCALQSVGSEEAEGTMTGTVELVEGVPVIQRHTHIVPAQKGISFGVVYTVLPEFSGEAVVETLHPPMGPDGITTETWQSTNDSTSQSYNGFTFDYDYELVPGAWKMSAHTLDGTLIYSVDFTVVAPGLAPIIGCGEALLG